VAVAGGPGSPGRTTVALGLASAIGCAQSAVLVDLDVTGPSVAAVLDADPTRNLAMLAHAEPSGPGEWSRALAQEVQPLGPGSRWGAVLCGLPKRQLRTVVSAPFVERLVAELRRSYAWVRNRVAPSPLTLTDRPTSAPGRWPAPSTGSASNRATVSSGAATV
jgi:Mrp family chromosome partitioning ATPase